MERGQRAVNVPLVFPFSGRGWEEMCVATVPQDGPCYCPQLTEERGEGELALSPRATHMVNAKLRVLQKKTYSVTSRRLQSRGGSPLIRRGF